MHGTGTRADALTKGTLARKLHCGNKGLLMRPTFRTTQAAPETLPRARKETTMPDFEDTATQINNQLGKAKSAIGDTANAALNAGSYAATAVADTAAEATTPESRAKFNKALDEAKEGAKALGKEMAEKGDVYREKIAGKTSELRDTARVKAASLAGDGKNRVSDGLTGLSKVVADNADTIDSKLGAKYGDYARTAARSIQETADRIDAKELSEMGEDAMAFIRKSPGLALGIAVVGGFMLARMFRGGSDNS